MLEINEIKLGTVINHSGQPYVVISANHAKKGRGGANLKTKLRNLITGQNLEITYSGGDKAMEADTERSKADFLYTADGRYYFMDNNSYEQFDLDAETVGEQVGYLKEGLTVDVLLFEGKPVSIKLPVKIDLLITDAPPGVKGDTATAASKIATLETGQEIRVPLFINSGEVIRVNTETGEYVERVNS